MSKQRATIRFTPHEWWMIEKLRKEQIDLGPNAKDRYDEIENSVTSVVKEAIKLLYEKRFPEVLPGTQGVHAVMGGLVEEDLRPDEDNHPDIDIHDSTKELGNGDH